MFFKGHLSQSYSEFQHLELFPNVYKVSLQIYLFVISFNLFK